MNVEIVIFLTNNFADFKPLKNNHFIFRKNVAVKCPIATATDNFTKELKKSYRKSAALILVTMSSNQIL